MLCMYVCVSDMVCVNGCVCVNSGFGQTRDLDHEWTNETRKKTCLCACLETSLHAVCMHKLIMAYAKSDYDIARKCGKTRDTRSVDSCESYGWFLHAFLPLQADSDIARVSIEAIDALATFQIGVCHMILHTVRPSVLHGPVSVMVHRMCACVSDKHVCMRMCMHVRNECF
jgi:hypothetical protein